MVAGEYCDVTTAGSPDGLSVSERRAAVSNLKVKQRYFFKNKVIHTLIKKKIKVSSVRKFRMEQLQSHT